MNLALFIKGLTTPKSITRDDGLLYWREKFFLILSLAFVSIGLFAYVFSMAASVYAKIWSVAVLDTFVYILVLIIFIFRNIKLKIRIMLLLSVVYSLSIALLLFLGPFGAGFIWLMMVPVLTALLLGAKETIISNIVNVISVIVLGVIIKYNFTDMHISAFDIKAWIAVSSNYVLASLAISIPVGTLLQALQNSLSKEKKLQNALRIQNRELYSAKESAEKADQLKSVYIANMAHEIRTPMNGILGFSNLLSSDKLEKTQQNRYIKIIEQRAEYLLRLINNIIDLSKLEAGQVEVDFEVINLDKLMHDLHDMFLSQIKSGDKNLKIVFKNTESSDRTIISDSTKIQQILINLINNAIKFTESGEIEFGYSMNCDYIHFYVKDTGIGIHEKDKYTIFERYRRSHNRLSVRNTEGTGLGLSITKGLVNLLGGEIWFETETEKGSTFYFTIPSKEIEPIRENIVKTTINMTTVWTETTILIVEDDPVSTELLNEVLSDTGAKLEFANNGQSALDICTHMKVDIVLMDIQLPGMNGQTALYEIKKLNKNIIVIAQTAYAMSGDKEKYIVQGFDDYIPKPIYPNILIEMLNKYIEQK